MSRLSNFFHCNSSASKPNSGTTTDTSANGTNGTNETTAAQDANQKAFIQAYADGPVNAAAADSSSNQTLGNTSNDTSGTSSDSNPTNAVNKLLEGLRPKLKELISEVLAEEQKLCPVSTTKDPLETLKRSPVIPSLATRSPVPVKNSIKDTINSISAKYCKHGATTDTNGTTGSDSSTNTTTNNTNGTGSGSTSGASAAEKIQNLEGIAKDALDTSKDPLNAIKDPFNVIGKNPSNDDANNDKNSLCAIFHKAISTGSNSQNNQNNASTTASSNIAASNTTPTASTPASGAVSFPVTSAATSLAPISEVNVQPPAPDPKPPNTANPFIHQHGTPASASVQQQSSNVSRKSTKSEPKPDQNTGAKTPANASLAAASHL